jgi:spermidine synthase
MAAAALVRHVPSLALATASVLGALPLLYGLDLAQGWSLASAGVVYALPAFGFGLMYGALVERLADDWGRDVGRYAAFNTLGSCTGILLATFVLLEMPLGWASGVLALGVLSVGLADLAATERPRAVLTGLASAAALGGVGLSVWGLSVPFTETTRYRSYWGRDGVVEVTTDGEVYIDGLWHTKLTDGVDHIGRPYSWLMATAALMAMERSPENALVVGAGVGISSVTLEGYEGLRVVGYEINHTLQPVLRDYPDATLHATDRPRIQWIWRDARTGMALDETRYDVILSAPLHLRQAGSSGLLSTEYLRLLKSRLAPDGVVAVYSNEGSDVQTALIRTTVAQHFRHQVSWYDGVVTLASDRPIEVDAATVRRFMDRDDRLAKELRRLDARLRREGWDDGVYSWYDGPVTGPWASEVISDDRPLVEYPELAEGRVGLLETLPEREPQRP